MLIAYKSYFCFKTMPNLYGTYESTKAMNIMPIPIITKIIPAHSPKAVAKKVIAR